MTPVRQAVGWRSVFVVSAVLMLSLAVVLARLLPAETDAKPAVSYRRLVGSVFTLTVRERVFRVRGLIALFMFGGFGALWGSMALPLTASPWQLSTAQVGLFGLIGASGRRVRRGPARWPTGGVSGIALVLFAGSWVAIAQIPYSLIPLVVGVVVLDFAGQSLHVTNQHLIVDIDPAASSRLIGGYMVYCSIGTGGGAIAATSLYEAFGWGAVCLLGAGLSTLGLLVWAFDRLTLGVSAARFGRGPGRPGRPGPV